MKRLMLLAAVALGVAVLPATPVAGQDTGAVTIVHAATYDAGDPNAEPPDPAAPLVVTLCVDDEVVDGSFELGDSIGPLDLAPGTYDVEVFIGADQDCAEGTADIQADLEVAAGDDVTAAAVWTSLTQGPSIVVWENDPECVEPDQARVTARHGAYTDGPVDIGAEVGGARTILFSDLGEGEQETIEVPSGTTAVDTQIFLNDAPIADLGDLGPLAGGTAYDVYAVGGADGNVGAFVLSGANPCDEPTTTTTAAPTTTARAAATATPRFTG
jgi:hypothetical protein